MTKGDKISAPRQGLCQADLPLMVKAAACGVTMRSSVMQMIVVQPLRGG